MLSIIFKTAENKENCYYYPSSNLKRYMIEITLICSLQITIKEINIHFETNNFLATFYFVLIYKFKNIFCFNLIFFLSNQQIF